MASFLHWVLPLTVILSSLADILLVWIYMKFLHPWKEILEQLQEVRHGGGGFSLINH